MNENEIVLFTPKEFKMKYKTMYDIANNTTRMGTDCMEVVIETNSIRELKIGEQHQVRNGLVRRSLLYLILTAIVALFLTSYTSTAHASNHRFIQIDVLGKKRVDIAFNPDATNIPTITGRLDIHLIIFMNHTIGIGIDGSAGAI